MLPFLVTLVLSLKELFDIGTTLKNLTNKIQSLEVQTNDIKKNIYAETEEFKAEVIIPLYYVTKEEGPKVIRK